MARGVDGLPFIDSVSTLRVTAAGTEQFLHEGETFPPTAAAPSCLGESGGDRGPVPARFLGSETKFVAAPGAPVTGEGILQLDQLTEKTVVGYLVGGMASTAPYGSTQGTTCASPVVYQVTVDPGQGTKTVALQPPESG